MADRDRTRVAAGDLPATSHAPDAVSVVARLAGARGVVCGLPWSKRRKGVSAQAAVPGRRGRAARAANAFSAHRRPAAGSVAVLVAVAVAMGVGLAGCGAQRDVATPVPAGEDAPSLRPAVALSPDLDGVTSVSGVNDAGDVIIGRAGPAGTEFYYQAPGARPVPLTHEGAPIEPRLLNNVGQVVGIVTDPAGREPPRLVRWQNGHSTVLPVHGDDIVPGDLNDRGQVTAITVTRPAGAPEGVDGAVTRACLTDGITTVDLGLDPITNEHNLYLNEAGQVAGMTFVDAGRSSRGFLWDDGELTTFDTGPTTHPVVMGISDRGHVVGLALDDQDSPSGANPIFRPAFRWQAGTTTMLATDGGGVGPVRINGSGQVAGVTEEPSGASRDVVVWSAAPDPAPIRLRRIADADHVVAINNHGDVLVSSTAGPTASPGGYLWHDGRFEVLGTLGGLATNPQGLSAAGLVVGEATDADGSWHATAWPPNGPAHPAHPADRGRAR